MEPGQTAEMLELDLSGAYEQKKRIEKILDPK